MLLPPTEITQFASKDQSSNSMACYKSRSEISNLNTLSIRSKRGLSSFKIKEVHPKISSVISAAMLLYLKVKEPPY